MQTKSAEIVHILTSDSDSHNLVQNNQLGSWLCARLEQNHKIESTKIVSTYRTSIKVWNIDTQECIINYYNKEFIFGSIAVLDHKTIVVNGHYSQFIFDASSEMQQPLKEIKTKYVTYILAINNETIVCISGATLLVINVVNNEQIVLKGHTFGIFSVAVLYDIIISLGVDNTLLLWDIATNTLLKSIQLPFVRSFCAIDASRIVLSNMSKIEIWDIRKSELVKSFDAYPVTHNMKALDHRTIVSIYKSTLALWDIEAGKQIYETELEHIANAISILNRDEFIINYDTHFEIWNGRVCKLMKRFDSQTTYVMPL
jgi:WD40 repeat protein